jgi:phasin
MPLTVVWFGTARSGKFIEAAGIANDTGRRDIMAQNQPFEIPQQLRELAERNVEQARAAYGQFMDAMVQATSMWMAAMPSNETTSGFKVVQERAIRFAKQNADACFALASELANAKDIQDVLAIQSRYAQTQMQAYALQAQELGRLMAEAAQSAQPRS